MEIATQSAAVIRSNLDLLADQALENYSGRSGGLMEHYNEAQVRTCRADIMHHLRFLIEAIEFDSVPLFAYYVEWLKDLLSQYHVSAYEVRWSIDAMGKAVEKIIPAGDKDRVNGIVAAAVMRIGQPTEAHASFIDPAEPMGEVAKSFLDHLLKSNTSQALALVARVISQGVSVQDLYQHVFRIVMYEVGRLWYKREISVAREHYCTGATQYIMSRLFAEAFEPGRCEPKVVVACVQGEHHQLGARMVADLLSIQGVDSIYLGADTPIREMVDLVAEEDAAVVCLSTTSPTNASITRDTITALKQREQGYSTRIIVGGGLYALDPSLVAKVGADHYAATVDEAIALFQTIGNE